VTPALHEWEVVACDLYGDETREVTTSRMRVPGGWLYEVVALDRKKRGVVDGKPAFYTWEHVATSVVFVPDGGAQ
jgi:hypothetical protein